MAHQVQVKAARIPDRDRLLQALREENRCHYYAGAEARHPSKLALLEALSPDSAAWRSRAIVHGLTLLHAAAKWTFEKQ